MIRPDRPLGRTVVRALIYVKDPLWQNPTLHSIRDARAPHQPVSGRVY